MKFFTWSRDCNGLFDYASDRVASSHLSTPSSCTLIRTDNAITLNFDPRTRPLPEDTSYMAGINLKSGHFSVLPLNRRKSEKVWLPALMHDAAVIA